MIFSTPTVSRERKLSSTKYFM